MQAVTIVQITPTELEELIRKTLESVLSNSSQKTPPNIEGIKFIPTMDIYEQKIMSKPTLYAHVRQGKITLYKFGGRSYVNKEEFEAQFQKTTLAP
jgi:hypothetical protein